jgi:hypothetical protein
MQNRRREVNHHKPTTTTAREAVLVEPNHRTK